MTERPAQPLRVTFLAWRDVRHPEGGGSELYVQRVAEYLARTGHSVTLRTARTPQAPRREVIDGVHIDRRGGRLTVYLWGLLHLLSRAGRRADVVIDVINGLPFAAPLVRRAGLWGLVHHVHREQWRMIYPDVRGRLGWFIESVVVPRLYRGIPLVTVSHATASDLLRLGFTSDKIDVIRNGLDSPGAMATKSDSPRLVVLARLVPHKQIEHALDVVAACLPSHPRLHLDVIGEGWWHDELTKHAAVLGVTDAVTFQGHVDTAARDQLLGEAWLMLLPSVKEGWSIAVTEAAAMCTPTIGYRQSGGLNESVDEGKTGWLVDDEQELIDTVNRLLAGPETLWERGEAARHRSLGLDWAASGAAFAALIAQRDQRSP